MTEVAQTSKTSSHGPEAASFPLTAVQQMLLLDPYINYRSVSCCVLFPDGLSSADVHTALDYLLREQPALTVRMQSSNGEAAAEKRWTQQTRELTAKDILIAAAPSNPSGERLARVQAQLAVLRLEDLDPRTAIGVRGTIIQEDSGQLLVLVMHHLVADALSRPLIVQTLERGLPGIDSSGDAPGADLFRQYAETETKSRASRPAASSRTADRLRETLARTQVAELDLRPVDRDQRAECFTAWVTDDTYLAFQQARASLGVTTYTALLSALFIELAARGGTPRPVVMTVRTRRVGRDARRIVGTFADLLILMAPDDLTSDTTVAEIATAVGTDLLRWLATREHFIDLVPAVTTAADYVSGAAGPVIALQFIDVAPRHPEQDRVRLWYRAETETNFDRMGVEDLHIICSDHGGALEVAAWAPPGRIPNGEVPRLLDAMVARVLALPEAAPHE